MSGPVIGSNTCLGPTHVRDTLLNPATPVWGERFLVNDEKSNELMLPQVNFCEKNESKLPSELPDQNTGNMDIPLYIFKDGYTFIDIIQNTHLASDERPVYYRWIMENFNIGHLNIGETSGFNFVSPWGDNSDRILKILKTLSL